MPSSEEEPLVGKVVEDKPDWATRGRKYISEFFCMYFLMVTIGCTVNSNNPYFTVLAICCCVVILAYGFAAVSGAHFNPVVTCAICYLNEDFKVVDAAFYIMFQFAGTFCGAGTYVALWTDTVQGNVFDIKATFPFTLVEAVWVEGLFTFFLVYVILCVALPSRVSGNEYYGLAIGFSIVAGGYATGMISGGVLNPAVGIAAAVVSGKEVGSSFAMALGEFIGGAVAAVMYKFFTHPEEYGKKSYPWVSRMVCEFLMTFVIVFSVGLSCSASVTMDNRHHALCYGGAILAATYAVAHVSGAHLNPAVTLAVYLTKRKRFFDSMFTWVDALSYLCAQALAGILAGIAFTYTTKKGGVPFDIGPKLGHKHWQMCIGELIFTFLICFTFLSVCTTRKSFENIGGIAMGFVYLVGGYSCMKLSEGLLNPAVTLGVGMNVLVYSNKDVWGCDIWLYWLAQFVGSGCAAALFWFLYPDEFKPGAAPKWVQKWQLDEVTHAHHDKGTAKTTYNVHTIKRDSGAEATSV